MLISNLGLHLYSYSYNLGFAERFLQTVELFSTVVVVVVVAAVVVVA